jgi:phosphoglycolate phosphatase
MFTQPDAVLFDLDGTLLDTARDLGNTLNALLLDKGMPTVDYEQYRNIASNGAKGMLELGFGEALKQYDFEQLRQAFLDHYLNHICIDTCYFDGIETLLTTLNQKSIPWGVVTNKPEGLTLALLKSFPLLNNCQVIIGGDTLAERKPHPLPLLHAQDQLSKNGAPLINPSTWYVGDAERDIEAANAANMVSVIAKFGYIEDNTNIEAWQADFAVETAQDLTKLL